MYGDISTANPNGHTFDFEWAFLGELDSSLHFFAHLRARRRRECVAKATFTNVDDGVVDRIADESRRSLGRILQPIRHAPTGS